MAQFSSEEAMACRRLIELALAEDLGKLGDRTSLATIPASTQARATFVARQEGVLAGLPALALVAQAIDANLVFEESLSDGQRLMEGDRIATIAGSLRSILAAERTALNFAQRLSGIASLTCEFVDAVKGYPARILDTRKTAPGWRLMDKYAVRMGGGTNHRLGLHDGILIKDNHLAGLGGNILQAVEAARAYPGNAGLVVEVEVDTLDQLKLALSARAGIVLLDNMDCTQLKLAVEMRNELAPEVLLEASGGVNLRNVRAVAATGVDRISIGALTHSAPARDIGLDYLS
jgi:nicotinate-nucleotide pyrophosphorylase (carboxylating)